MTMQEYLGTEYLDTAFEYIYDFVAKIPGRIGFAVGFAIEAGRMFTRNAIANLPAMLEITANFTRNWVGAAIGTAGILAVFSIASPATSVGLLLLGQAGFSFPLRLAVASAFAGVMSGFQWQPADPRQPSFLKGLTTYFAPFTMLTLAIAKPVLLSLGILKEKTYTADINGQTVRYQDVQSPMESTEVADEHLDRALQVGKAAVNEMIASGNYGKEVGEMIISDAAIIAGDIKNTAYSAVASFYNDFYAGWNGLPQPTAQVAQPAQNVAADPTRARVDAAYAAVNSVVTPVRDGLYHAFVQTPGEAFGLLDPVNTTAPTTDMAVELGYIPVSLTDGM